MDNPTIAEYFEAWSRHDLYWARSDDNRVYNHGRCAEDRLRELAEDQPHLQPVYDAWTAARLAKDLGRGWAAPLLEDFTDDE